MEISSILWVTSVTSWKMAGVRKKEILPRKGKRLPDTLVIEGFTGVRNHWFLAFTALWYFIF